MNYGHKTVKSHSNHFSPFDKMWKSISYKPIITFVRVEYLNLLTFLVHYLPLICTMGQCCSQSARYVVDHRGIQKLLWHNLKETPSINWDSPHSKLDFQTVKEVIFPFSTIAKHILSFSFEIMKKERMFLIALGIAAVVVAITIVVRLLTRYIWKQPFLYIWRYSSMGLSRNVLRGKTIFSWGYNSEKFPVWIWLNWDRYFQIKLFKNVWINSAEDENDAGSGFGVDPEFAGPSGNNRPLKFASFNIQIFGKRKMQQEDVVDVLVKVGHLSIPWSVANPIVIITVIIIFIMITVFFRLRARGAFKIEKQHW